jgi:hypothetical protein
LYKRVYGKSELKVVVEVDAAVLKERLAFGAELKVNAKAFEEVEGLCLKRLKC